MRRARSVTALLVVGLVAAGAAGCTRGTAPQPAPSESRALAAAPSAGPGTTTIGGVLELDVPGGWTVVRNSGDAPYGRNTAYACLTPRAAADRPGCLGLQVIVGGHLPGNEGSRYRAHQAGGWSSGTDVAPCPVGRRSTPEYLNATDPAGAPVVRGRRQVGTRAAAYDRWRAGCADGSVFRPQAWFLAKEHVLIRSLTLPSHSAVVDGILATARFADRPADAARLEVVIARLTDASAGAVRLAGGRTLLLTDRTACLAHDDPFGDLLLVDCRVLADRLATHPARRLDVVVYVDSSGGVAQVAVR